MGFGISTSVLAALCLLFSTGKYDVAHENNSGVNYFCMVEQLLIILLYVCIIFFERVQQYLLSLSWFQGSAPAAPSISVAKPENTNDNFQHIVVEIPKPEPVPEPRESKLSDDDDMVIVHKIEQNQAEAIAEAKDDVSEKTDSVSETDELIEPPTKELHAQVGERKSSDV